MRSHAGGTGKGRVACSRQILMLPNRASGRGVSGLKLTRDAGGLFDGRARSLEQRARNGTTFQARSIDRSSSFGCTDGHKRGSYNGLAVSGLEDNEALP